MIREYVKLVTGTGHGYRSFLNPFSSLSLEYVPGERTVPKVGGILAFRTLVDAHAFWQTIHGSSSVLLAGRGEEMPLPETRHSGFPSYPRYEEHVRAIWAGATGDPTRIGAAYGWPPGTVALAWFEPATEMLQTRKYG